MRDEVRALVNTGRPRASLSAHVRNWRQCRTPYTIENAVRLAAEEKRGADLHDTLLDKEFQDARRRMFDVNALRADLHVARTYFLTCEPDLVRYLQVLLVEQRPVGTPESVLAQQGHCRDYSDFLQLDRLAHERLDTGLHRVLGRFFDACHDTPDSPVSLRLTGYELGEWRRSCGGVSGHARRYDYTCPCGAVLGTGRITPATAGCARPGCDGSISYVVCPACRTRVTLSNLWRIMSGGAGAEDFQLPVLVDLVAEYWSEPVEVKGRLLLRLPLPIGTRERHGEIEFETPVVFWESFSVRRDRRGDDTDRFLGLKDSLRYDGRTELRPILENLLRRTLLGYRNGYRAFTRDLADDVVNGSEQRRRRGKRLVHGLEFSRGLWMRLCRVTVRDLELGDLVSRGAVSARCTVAASARLQGAAVLLHERLAEPELLTVPTLLQLNTTLSDGSVVTAEPPQVRNRRTAHLEPCGLATPGTQVFPGDVLVGAATPVPEDESYLLTPEERLLKAIFNEPPLRDRSVVMPGALPGHVLEQRIIGALGTDDIPAAAGRHVRGGGSATSITVTVAVDQPLQHGDKLDDEAGTSAVVCGLVGGPVLRQLTRSAREPDLVVAPDHPWAPEPGETTRVVEVRLAAHDLAGPGAGARSTGGYNKVLQRPLGGEFDGAAQTIEPRELRWLVENGARHLVWELFGPRGDCPDWRTGLRTSLETGDRSLGAGRGRVTDLSRAPTYGVRRLDLTLRAARIDPVLDRDRIVLRPMTDSDVLRLSQGEVVNEQSFDVISARPVPGGLFCQKIFGPDRDNECVCGAPHARDRRPDAVCTACGRTLTTPNERGVRFGHIELPVPVVHSWYLTGEPCRQLARLLGLTEEEFLRLVDRELALEGDALVDNSFSISGTVLSGGEAVRHLLLQAGDVGEAGRIADAVVFQRLPVLPPALRPQFRTDFHTWVRSELNELYRRVLFHAAWIRRQSAGYSFAHSDTTRLLQKSVTTLLGISRTRATAGSDDRRPEGLARTILSNVDITGPLRDDFHRRTVDYSARTRLVISRLPDEDDSEADPDVAVLGRRQAFRLLEPLVIRAMISGGAAVDAATARTRIKGGAVDVWRLLDEACDQAMIVVAVSHGPWPMVAMRLRTSEIPALQVQPALLDLIGWRNLGDPVRIFSVLSREGVEDATAMLPSREMRRSGSVTRQERRTFFDLPCADLTDRLAEAALSTDSLPVSAEDRLLFCDPRWLSL